ncbi:MAG: CotH kinase family protein, partial [Treponema sp.]|nr:CotH kinase family protein [Treponema sp.]
KYGVDKDNVISFDNGELDDGNPGEENLFWQMMNMRSRDMSNTAEYNAFCEVFDIDNFVDYWAAQIYIYNEDWPQNNYRLWRTRTKETGNPYGDTKWRWQMFDTEFAMGIYNGGGLTGQAGMDAFAKILNGENRNHHNNQLFKALLANEDFCRRFVNTMMDLYNVNFHPDSYLPKLNSYAAIYKPLMDDYYTRWGLPWQGFQFQNKVNEVRTYLNNIRNAMVNNYLPKYFGGYSGIANIGISSGNLRDVTISATGISGASIKINTVTPDLASGSWTGKYYSGNPITVTASPAPSGYEFDGWTVSGGSAANPSSLTTAVNITGNAQITAKYKQTGVDVVHATGITLNSTTLSLNNATTNFNLIANITPSNATYKTVSWESSDYGVANVDSGGKVSVVRTGTATITASTVNNIKATCTVTVDYNPVLLDLASAIQGLAVQTINDWSKFNSVFSGIPVRPTWPGEGVTYSIINQGGIKKIQIDEHAMWGPGLDITPNFTFRAGDIIEVKGTHLSNSHSDGMQIQKEFDDPWSAFSRWYISPGQDFEEAFTLTAEDAVWFNANIARDGVAMRIRTNGKEPWVSPNEPNYQSGYVGSFVIEQFKVSRP